MRNRRSPLWRRGTVSGSPEGRAGSVARGHRRPELPRHGPDIACVAHRWVGRYVMGRRNPKMSANSILGIEMPYPGLAEP